MRDFKEWSFREWLIVLATVVIGVILFLAVVSTASAISDSCPNGGYLQGFDKETGAPVCKEQGKTDPSQTNVVSHNTENVAPVDIPVDSVYNSDFAGK